MDLCDEAEHYSSYAAGFIAVAKAWGEDTLLPGLGNTKAQVAPGRKHGPAGAGDRNRGYVDYEFLDGNGVMLPLSKALNADIGKTKLRRRRRKFYGSGTFSLQNTVSIWWW